MLTLEQKKKVSVLVDVLLTRLEAMGLSKEDRYSFNKESIDIMDEDIPVFRLCKWAAKVCDSVILSDTPVDLSLVRANYDDFSSKLVYATSREIVE